MKYTVLTVCLLVLAVAPAGVVGTHNKCSPSLPRPMKLKTFEYKVFGKTTYTYYRADAGALFDPRFNLKFKYTKQGDTYRVAFFSRALDDVSSGKCDRAVKYNLPPPEEACDDRNDTNCGRAVFTSELTNVTQFYFSSEPEKYFMIFGCQTIKERCCLGDYYVLINGYSDTPDSFPWNKVNADLKEQLNIRIDHPDFKFIMKNLACPNKF